MLIYITVEIMLYLLKHIGSTFSDLLTYSVTDHTLQCPLKIQPTCI